MKITLAKHALDSLEEKMDDDEIQEFLDELKKMVEDGSFLEEGKPVDMELMELEEPELYKELMEAMEDLDSEPKLH